MGVHITQIPSLCYDIVCNQSCDKVNLTGHSVADPREGGARCQGSLYFMFRGQPWEVSGSAIAHNRNNVYTLVDVITIAVILDLLRIENFSPVWYIFAAVSFYTIWVDRPGKTVSFISFISVSDGTSGNSPVARCKRLNGRFSIQNNFAQLHKQLHGCGTLFLIYKT